MRNIVLVTFDSLRADHCGQWGYKRDTTPNLDEMAEDGVVYEKAIAPASRTNPSMAGIFTGEHMVFRDQVSNPAVSRSHLSRHGTVSEELSTKGYETAAFNPNAYASRYFGFDRGFDRYEDFLFSEPTYQTIFDKTLSNSERYRTLRNLRNLVRREEVFRTWETYVDEAVAWIESRSEPFFLWLFSLDTHFPYLTPRRHREWSSLIDQYYYNWRCHRLIDQVNVDVSDDVRQKLIDIYDDSIKYADMLLGELREQLSEFDPLFVVHGDHGEAFAEHGMYGHFYPTLREENVHTPLVVFEEAGRETEVDHPVSLCEIPRVIDDCVEDGTSGHEPVGDAPVVATDYDGRRNRDLVAAWLNRYKVLAEETPSGREVEFIETTDDCVGDSVEPELEEALRSIVARRTRHEMEIHGIRDAVASLDQP